MKIVVLDSNTLGEDLDLSSLNSLGDVNLYECTKPNEVAKRIEDCDVLLLNKVKLNEENLKFSINLKLICVFATGFDNIDVVYCKKRGIAVCNVKGYSTNSVAQITFALALSLLSNLKEYNEYVEDNSYTNSGVQNKIAPTFHELNGLTWGIAGYGNIGKKVGDIAKSFDCNIIAYKKTPDCDVDLVDIDTLCEKSDIISIHLPLNSETNLLFNEKRIAKMKKSAILINVARGSIVDEFALTNAIINRKIGGIGIDVYSTEPFLKNHPYQKILNYKNVCLTPHMAWGAYEARKRCLTEVIKNIEAFFSGEIRNRVDI